jgi:hypothetical protein
MRKWFAFLFILWIMVTPFPAQAQSAIKFSGVQVELRPEYDQPSMLLIYDFKLASGISLPVDVTFRIPKDDNLIAVASLSNGQLLDANYTGPTLEGDWQVIQINVMAATTYHVEYYAPIIKTSKTRQFSYSWISDYPVDAFNFSIYPPSDVTQFTSDPTLDSVTNQDGTISWQKNFGTLAPNQPFNLKINYNRSSDKLTKSNSQSGVQPSQPLDSNTPGSFMATFSNVIPYVLGGAGLIIIGGVIVYFWQSTRNNRNRSRRKHSPHVETEGNSEVYCHQCGTRAHKGDRFCRVCGTKLRREA